MVDALGPSRRPARTWPGSIAGSGLSLWLTAAAGAGAAGCGDDPCPRGSMLDSPEGLEVTAVFQEATLLVKRATRFEQEPWMNWSLNDRIVLKRRKSNNVIF